jgi:hypothetical protein
VCLQGLKTSEEIQQEQLLRQAWDAPGSPFAGQAFNPSAVNWGSEGGGRNLSSAADAPMNSPNADLASTSGSSSGPDYDSMIAAAQGPEERAKLQAMQAKRLSRLESMNSGQPDSATRA